ncbi:PREDICTED: uncharacterized protein LOC106300194 [Brassica oleracea var. oleracea]|uniref:PWWP domain-containing protein n=1 Tax=Brassica oleracea var. oleracea TaxID=109376 RepID=A0A0D3CT20_BRAOL|nr:PREDICTED: uncharacterized protein LOC106300194 [Brassica oleracea var. oleracea]
MEMETVEGIGEETRPRASSSETGSAKQNDVAVSGEKTLKENGVRVSENGEHKVADESGVIEDCVMNGVSSLLKLKQDVSDNSDAKDEDGEEEEHGYHVGDFVWGKIKNHPWWPGQIYDPSEASDLALKIKQKGKMLVAYFGDGTFAWCGASQLKPFAESFKECSNVSSSRGIVTAVEEAVEEMGRHMERLLIRDCTVELDNRVVKNAGIKEGVAVRDVRREMISSLLVGKPEGILQDVKGFAETVSFSGLLELEIVKRKVSAFFRSKRGYGLTEFPEAQPVPGLEDKNNDDDDDDDEDEDFDDGGARRSTVEKGKEEEALVPEESIQRPLEKCSGFPDHRLQHRRKQKSIAEILENESCARVRFEIEPDDGKGKSSRKKVKRSDELVTTTNPRSRRMKEVASIKEDIKGKRKRKKRDEEGSGEREEDEADNDSTPLASLRKRAKVDDASSAGNGETSTQNTSKRERKKSSKYFSPEFLSDFSSKGRKKTKTEPESSKVPSQSQGGELMANASNSLVVVEEEDNNSCELLQLENGAGHQELSEELSNAVDFLRLGATTEEIRDLIRVSALGTEYPKDSSSRDMVREFMSIYRSFTYHEGVNSKFLGSYNTADTDKEEMNGTGKPEEIEQTGKEENETTKKQRKPKTPTSKKQADEVEESRKEVTETTKKERKRKKPESEKKAHEEEESTKKERKAKKPKSRKQGDEEEEASGSTKKDKKGKKPKFEEEETPNESGKKEREGKTKKQEFSGAELFVTFGPGSTLPKKEALIEIYGKFGALDEERSYVLDSNLCARVAFLNVDDGEKAFESSLENSPFASTSTVKFRLKYPNERAGEKKGEAEAAETKTVEMEHLKNKFEEMISLVDKSQGRMTEEVKVKLEEEMVNLLEEVRKMPLS